MLLRLKRKAALFGFPEMSYINLNTSYSASSPVCSVSIPCRRFVSFLVNVKFGFGGILLVVGSRVSGYFVKKYGGNT